jgi:hypothetical protein
MHLSFTLHEHAIPVYVTNILMLISYTNAPLAGGDDEEERQKRNIRVMVIHKLI